MVVNQSSARGTIRTKELLLKAVIADVTGHPCRIGENMEDSVSLSGYHLMLSEGCGKQVRILQKWVVKASLVYCVPVALFLTISLELGSSNKAKPKRTVSP